MPSEHDLAAVLYDYECWEADLIMDSQAWREGEERGDCLPRIPQYLWDRLIEIQERRNAVLSTMPRYEQMRLGELP